MNISDIRVGEIFPSYRAFCKALGLEPKEGDSKPAQEKEISSFIKYEKITRTKIKILKIYETPKIINNDSHLLPDYTKYGQIVLLLWLMEHKENKVIASKSKIAQSLAYVNQKFFSVKNNGLEYSENNNIDIYHVWDFLNTTTNKYTQAVDTILSKLQNDKAIFYNKIMMIQEIYLEEDGKKNSCTRPATDTDRRIILQIENEELNKVGCLNKKHLKNRSQSIKSTFEKNIKKRLNKEMNIDYYYDAYDIIMNKDGLQRVLDKYHLSDVDSQSIKNIVKNSFKTGVVQNASNRVLSACAKKEEIENMEKAFNNPTLTQSQIARMDSSYLRNIKTMANDLLN